MNLLLDSALMTLTSLPNSSNLEDCFNILEKFVVLMYDSTSTSNTANETRKILHWNLSKADTYGSKDFVPFVRFRELSALERFCSF